METESTAKVINNKFVNVSVNITTLL